MKETMMSKHLIKLDIFTTTQGLDILELELTMLGQPAFVVVDHTDFDNLLDGKYGAWDYFDVKLTELSTAETTITLYLTDDDDGKKSLFEIKEMLKRLQGSDSERIYGRLECDVSVIKNEDWESNWRDSYTAFTIGENIIIAPPWDKGEYEGKTVIRLEPGRAFGTGADETTRLSLELLEKWMTEHKRQGKPEAQAAGITALDIGCGSGILAIGAVLMGVKKALGVDIDPVAVETAAENAEVNAVSERVEFACGNLIEQVSEAYDIVCANIIADIIIRLLPDVQRVLKPGGCLILSGIIADREQEVMDKLTEFGFSIWARKKENDWVGLAVQGMK